MKKCLFLQVGILKWLEQGVSSFLENQNPEDKATKLPTQENFADISETQPTDDSLSFLSFCSDIAEEKPVAAELFERKAFQESNKSTKIQSANNDETSEESVESQLFDTSVASHHTSNDKEKEDTCARPRRKAFLDACAHFEEDKMSLHFSDNSFGQFYYSVCTYIHIILNMFSHFFLH